MRKKLFLIPNLNPNPNPNPNLIPSLISSLILVLILFVSSFSTLAAPAAEIAAKGLHRLDFRLEKASCPTCIIKVRKALRATTGVVACETALRKPYGAVIIFQPDKVTVDKMKKVAQEADPNKRVEFADVLDKPINSVPALLLPIYNNLQKGP
jgi:copper chaperone CopZ